MKSCSGSNGSSSKVDRKTVEKNRRIHMKTLCFKLGSLIPKEHRINTKDAISQHDHLDQAATYIRNLKARIEKLKQRKKNATGTGTDTDTGGEPKDREAVDCEIPDELGLPVVEVAYRDSVLEVILINGGKTKKKFMFYQVIGVLVEEGAEVVNASFSAVGDKIFYTVHCQATSTSRSGVDASRISERLKELLR